MSLLDQFGNPIDLTSLRDEVATPTVTGVRNHLSSHPSVGLTPTRLANLLRDSEEGDPQHYLELAEEMEEKDLHYLSVLGTRKRAVSQLEITVESAGDSADDVKNVELVQNFLDRECLENELFDIMDSVGKGFSLSEIIWDMSESQWMPARLEWVNPKWLELDQVDRRTLMLRHEDGPQPLQPFKFVYHEAKAKSGLPIRGGIARAAGWCYLFKNFGVKSWVIFSEVYGHPIRVGKYHPGATPEDRRTLLRAVSSIGTDAAAIMPSNMMIDFIDTKVTASGDFHEKLVKFMEQQISKGVLGQTTTTDAISGGHAVSKEHNEVREDIERADAKQLAATLNANIVRPLIDLNRGPQKTYPQIRIGRSEHVDPVAYTQSVDKMAKLGLPIKRSEIYGTLGWEKPEDDEDVFVYKAPPKGNPNGDAETDPDDTDDDEAVDKVTNQSKDDLGEPGSGPDAIDDLEGDLLDGWEEVMAPMVQPLQEIFDSAENYEDLQAKLGGAIQSMDPTAFQDALARGTFSVRLGAAAGAPVRDKEEPG